MKYALSIAALCAVLAACSDSAPGGAAYSGDSFPDLPTSNTDMTTLEGLMTSWKYEGSTGCYGTISDGNTVVQLWMDALSCGDQNVKENEQVSIDVIFAEENQYGPGKTYTIIYFN